MHASLHELLKLRDEPVDARADSHVASCPRCRAELERLRLTTHSLRSLRPRWTMPDRWSAIRAELEKRPSPYVPEPPRARPGWWLPAATAAAVLLAVIYALNHDKPAQVANAPAPAAETGEPAVTVASPAENRALIEESQRLEALLYALPENPRVIRAGTALTLAELQDRIEWVDYRLATSLENNVDRDVRQQLWRERVDLLNSMVAVRYASARTDF